MKHVALLLPLLAAPALFAQEGDKIPLTIKVGPDGRVLEMKGVDEALDAARKKAGQMGGQMLGGSLNTGMIERMIEGAFGQLPTEPMAVGGVWERKRTETASRMNVQTS